MLATSRSLFRVDLARSLTNTCIKKCCLFSDMDKRKRKVVVSEWRPVSTQAKSEAISSQSSSHGGNVVKDVKFEVQDTYVSTSGDQQELERQVEEVDHSVSSDVSKLSLQNSGADAVNERADLKGKSVTTETHSVTMEVGASLMRFIKGKGGATQKKLEEELEVKLIFPSSRQEDNIVIEGNSTENVSKAAEKIQFIIDEAVKSPNLDYSHFVSLPLAMYPELVDKLFKFQNSILGTTELNQGDTVTSDTNEENSDDEVKEQILDEAPRIAVQLKAEDSSKHAKVDIANVPLVSYVPKAKSSASESKTSRLSKMGIEKSIFIKPKTFHLTVLMLKLWNKDRVKAATEVLQNVLPKVVNALDGRPLFIRLKGLRCMRPPLAKARVLYSAVEEVGDEDRLSRACQVIIEAFVEAGLVLEKDARQKLLLHATIMNARHRKRKNRTRKVDSFDARGIMEQYGSEEWGEYLVREAHLSQRFVFDESGYYHCCASIPFPKNM